MKYPQLEAAIVQDWSEKDETIFRDYMKSRTFESRKLDAEDYQGIKPKRPDLTSWNDQHQVITEVKSRNLSKRDLKKVTLVRRIEGHLSRVRQPFNYVLSITNDAWNPADRELKELKQTVIDELKSLPFPPLFPYKLRLGGHPKERLYRELIRQQPENAACLEEKIQKLREEGNGRVAIALMAINNCKCVQLAGFGSFGAIAAPSREDDWLQNEIGESAKRLRAIPVDCPKIVVIFNHSPFHFDDFDCTSALFGESAAFQPNKNTTVSALVIAAHAFRCQLVGQVPPYAVYHNPFAKHPLPTGIFQDGENEQYEYDGGQVSVVK